MMLYVRHLNLRVVHEFERRRIRATTGCKVDNDIRVWVFAHSLFDLLIYWQLQIRDGFHKSPYQSFLSSPVLFENELPAEGVDDPSNGGRLPSTDEIKVQHALNGLGLQAIHESAGIFIEELIFESRELGGVCGGCGRRWKPFNAIIGRSGEGTFSSDAIGRADTRDIGVDAGRWRWHDENLGKLFEC